MISGGPGSDKFVVQRSRGALELHGDDGTLSARYYSNKGQVDGTIVPTGTPVTGNSCQGLPELHGKDF